MTLNITEYLSACGYGTSILRHAEVSSVSFEALIPSTAFGFTLKYIHMIIEHE